MQRHERHAQEALRQAQVLGDLVSATLAQPPRDPGQWSAIEGRLSHRPRPRWRILVPALGTALALIVGVAALRTLRYEVQGLGVADHGNVVTTGAAEGSLTFEEGTRVLLSPSTQARIHPFAFRRGARLVLDRGRARLAVVHRRGGRWEVSAGPFAIEVTGTRFDVDWRPQDAQLELSVTEGEVQVSGSPLQPRTTLRAGQRLSVFRDRVAVADLEVRRPLAVAVPRPAPEVPTPAVPAATPGPVITRRSRAHRGVKSPSPAEKAVPTPAPAPIVAPVPPATPVARAQAAPARTIPGATGPLWVDGGSGTVFASRAPIYEFEDGMLCARGTIAALACANAGTSSIRCDWDTNWGALVGWKARTDGGAWGSAAASQLSVEYRGRGTRFRLVAHRRGDPPRKAYCVSGYRSGKVVKASQFKTECWENSGASLPSFAEVDRFGIQVASEEREQAFRICVSSVSLF